MDSLCLYVYVRICRCLSPGARPGAVIEPVLLHVTPYIVLLVFKCLKFVNVSMYIWFHYVHVCLELKVCTRARVR